MAGLDLSAEAMAHRFLDVAGNGFRLIDGEPWFVYAPADGEVAALRLHGEACKRYAAGRTDAERRAIKQTDCARDLRRAMRYIERHAPRLERERRCEIAL